MANETEANDAYSPLLAKMLNIAPDAKGLSLAALGRQALGADSEEYAAAKAEVDAARLAMVEALKSRQTGPDQSMLALAQGFLAPTRTGSFGESLGSATGKYAEAQRTEAENAREMAKLRYELAKAGMSETTEAAKLGLSVASKLTPQMTAMQKQVRAEGIDPTSPAGVARLRELTAMGQATPEMKAFAARSGLSVTDPAFAAKFDAFERNKPLADIATREGLDLNDPEQLAKARRIQQASSARTTMPEIAKVLEEIGGDINNPVDVTRARDILQRRTMRTENPAVVKILEEFGGDVNKPADLDRARRLLQQRSARSDSPEIAKIIEQTGGDINNPADVKKAQGILAAAERTKRDQAAATLAQTTASTARTRQEIEAAKRSQGEGAGTGAAPAAPVPVNVRNGVPVSPVDKYAGMTPKEASDARRKDKEEADKFIRDKVAPFMGTVDGDIDNLKRALALNSQISTGVTYGLPYVGGAAKVLSGDRAKINEFDALSALSAKQNRIPGDSNVSNLDVKMMQLGTFSSDKEPITNKTIIEFQLAQRERDRDFNSYISNYASVNGRVDAEAQSQWRKYLDANPITTRDAKGRVQLNPNRMTYQQYFTMPRVQVDAQGREAR
jgi:hypothetical protein